MLLVALIIIAVSGLLTKQRYDDFLAYHDSIALGTVRSIAQEIEEFVEEQHRRVKLFAEDHAGLLLAIADEPDNYLLQEQLVGRIKRRFPDYFAFTLTDKHGEPRIQDFDGYVGGFCIADVKDFSSTMSNLVRIHPNSFAYHFDVMSPYGGNVANSGILLISFHADVLGSLLRSGEVPGHQLLLSLVEQNHLIEVTSEGTRVDLDRADFNLSEDELAHEIYSQKIAGTRWTLTNLYRAGFREAYQRELVITLGLVVGVVLLVLLIITYIMQRLEQSRARAESFKEEFLSVVSHELRTPITAIQGALSLLQYQFKPENEQCQELINIAEANSRRLRLLVDDLLELRTLDAGKLNLDYQVCHLNQLVAESLQENQGYADKCGVSFVQGREAARDAVNADVRRIKQVMANYLSNAAKFSPEGSVVTAHVEMVDGDRIRVSVVDQGEGVPREFQAHLFEKFSQADGSSTRKIAGTGLGLAIVKGFIEAHGGEVGFESIPGKGATFYFELPLTSG